MENEYSAAWSTFGRNKRTYYFARGLDGRTTRVSEAVGTRLIKVLGARQLSPTPKRPTLAAGEKLKSAFLDIDSETFEKNVLGFFQSFSIADEVQFCNMDSLRKGNQLQLIVKGEASVTYSCSPHCPSWEEIQCKEIAHRVKSTCKLAGNILPPHRAKKVFVKGHQSLLSYIIAIQTNTDRDVHRHVFNYVRSVLLANTNWKVINHNKDVNILHLKFQLL